MGAPTEGERDPGGRWGDLLGWGEREEWGERWGENPSIAIGYYSTKL